MAHSINKVKVSRGNVRAGLELGIQVEVDSGNHHQDAHSSRQQNWCVTPA